MSNIAGGLFQGGGRQQDIIIRNLSSGLGYKLGTNCGQDNVIGFGHRCRQHFIIGGTIGEDDIKADYLGSSLA